MLPLIPKKTPYDKPVLIITVILCLLLVLAFALSKPATMTSGSHTGIILPQSPCAGTICAPLPPGY